MKRLHFLSLVLSTLCCLSVQADVAPKQSDATQQALKKAQGVLRQLSEEKNALEAEKKVLAQEKTDLLERIGKLESQVKQLEPLQSEVTAQKANADNLRSANQTLSGHLNHAQENARQLTQKWQETQAQARLIQADNQQLILMVKEREQAINQCHEKNKALISAASELSEKYQHKSFWEVISESEPLTGIGNVQVQNDIENFQYQLQDLKISHQ